MATPQRIDAIAQGATLLHVPLVAGDAARLSRLIDELLHWNRAHNLTSLTDPDAIVTHHILDSLSAHADLAGARIADVGTGGGFPGLPLALANPSRQFTLIDSNAKKLSFVAHAAHELGLTNVRTEHDRVEKLRPLQPYDTVITRAFAPLSVQLKLLSPVVALATRVVAMKGRWPEKGGSEEIPRGWRLLEMRRVTVPRLDAERHILILQRDRLQPS
ncbi:MAG: 16S rRNA (guanine(527)-N(7))-methyltransferase RsmG [Steroidobacteraceae bacterium]